MTLLSLVFASLVTQATAPKVFFGNWKIARSPKDESWVGKAVTFQKNEMAYEGGFLWFNRPCRSARFRIEPYRQTQNDPTTPQDYGLTSYPRESLTVKCVWPDGTLTPTFSFDVVNDDRMTIYWDGVLIFLERE